MSPAGGINPALQPHRRRGSGEPERDRWRDMRGVKRPSHSNVMGASRPARGFYSTATRPCAHSRPGRPSFGRTRTQGSGRAAGRIPGLRSVTPLPGRAPQSGLQGTVGLTSLRIRTVCDDMRRPEVVDNYSPTLGNIEEFNRFEVFFPFLGCGIIGKLGTASPRLDRGAHLS